METKNIYNMEQAVSANGRLDVDIDGEHHNILVTVRNGADPERVASVVSVYIEGIRILRKAYPLTEVVKEAQAQAAPVSSGETKKPYQPTPVPENELPAELVFGDSEGGPIEFFKDAFDYCVVEPQPDDKATVKFYKTGLQFPVGASINKWKVGNVAEALTALGDIDPTKAQKIVRAGVQFWVRGSEYVIAKGQHAGQKSHYKNLKLILAA